MTLHQLLGLSLSVFATIGLGCDEDRTKPAKTTVVVWDLGTDQSTSRVGWPADVSGDGWTIDEQTTISLDLGSNGRIKDVVARYVDVGRTGDRVRSVVLKLPASTVEEAFTQATAFCDAFNLKERERLEKWRRSDGSFNHNEAEVLRIAEISDLKFQRWIEIRRTFAGPEKPWYVTFAVLIPPRPASRPAD